MTGRWSEKSSKMSEQDGLVGEREAFNELGVLLYRLLGPGDDRLEFVASVTAVTNEQHIRAYNPDGKFPSGNGPFNDARGSYELSKAMKRLREASYREGSGTWFGVHVTVTASGSATAEYNYDDEPQWDAPVDPLVYVRDQEKFPRAEDKQPEWLKQRLAEGRARIFSQGT
jgi:hypothetical protein